MRAIIKSALAINELAFNLKNISIDDKKEIDEYTDSEIVREAQYVLSLFLDESEGHANFDDWSGEGGPDAQKFARGEVRKLKALIKKYH